jgi:hypothetical protein
MRKRSEKREARSENGDPDAGHRERLTPFALWKEDLSFGIFYRCAQKGAAGGGQQSARPFSLIASRFSLLFSQ